MPRLRTRWKSLPVLKSASAILRELHPLDVPALLALLEDEEVQRFSGGAPTTEKAFLRYIRWAQRSRRIGQHLSFGVVPRASDTVVGIFQIWPLEPSFEAAEWGFALGKAFWGTGLFTECAEQILDFAMDRLGVRRLEARAAVDNIRGNAALQKLGAVREGILRQCFQCDGQPRDHVMWAILRDDWHRFRKIQSSGDCSHVPGSASGSPREGFLSCI